MQHIMSLVNVSSDCDSDAIDAAYSQAGNRDEWLLWGRSETRYAKALTAPPDSWLVVGKELLEYLKNRYIYEKGN